MREFEEYFSLIVHLYGNHDAWPGKIPVGGRIVASIAQAALPAPLTQSSLICFEQKKSRRQIQRHRRRLRTCYFREHWPAPPHVHKAPELSVEVQLYALNTVIHDPELNMLAIGEVKEDRYWERGARKANKGIQLRRIASLIEGAQPAAGTRVVRLLATHHPVCISPQQENDIYQKSAKKLPFLCRRPMVLRHRDKVAKKLGLGTSDPLIHVVISGHTHRMYPEVGSQPDCQIVVGSLSSLRYHHQIGVLRIGMDDEGRLFLDRMTAMRSFDNRKDGEVAHHGAFGWTPEGNPIADRMIVRA